MDNLMKAKIELRESTSPFFSDEEINYYIEEKHDGDFNAAMYEMCILKSENDSISLPGGLSIANNSEYWLRLAEKYKPSKKVVMLW